MARNVTVGSRLPHGLIIELPSDPTKTVELNGKNKSLIIGADYGTTEVDADFWEQWFSANKEYPAIKSGAIFVAKSAADAVSVAAELREQETGFEPMRTDGKDKRASGVKKADNKD